MGLETGQKNIMLRLIIFALNLTCLVVSYKSSYTINYINGPIIWQRRLQDRSRNVQLNMAMDEFFIQKLDSMRRTFSALTERLADPDVANDRYLFISKTEFWQ